MNKHLGLIALSLGVLAAPCAMAAPVTYNTAGAPVVVGGVEHEITGGDMAGMLVEVVFTDGTFNSSTWQTDPGDLTHGFASTSNWSAHLTGDSFSETWSFAATKGVESVTFSGGGVLFDRTTTASGGGMVSVSNPGNTFGSTTGFDYAETGFDDPNPFPTSVTYANPVSLNGDPLMWDLWASLTLTFDGGLPANSVVNFRQDTDLAGVTPVPVPAAAWLFASGLLGLVAAARRHRG